MALLYIKMYFSQAKKSFYVFSFIDCLKHVFIMHEFCALEPYRFKEKEKKNITVWIISSESCILLMNPMTLFLSD